MRQSIAADRPGLLQSIAAFLLGSEDRDDENTLDTFRGFRDPDEEARRGRRAAFRSEAPDVRPN